jgi:DNA polymerase-3 subunit delta
MAPRLKPAYLIHGDDHGALAERRAGLRALAESQGGGATGVELLEGDAATPAGVAAALAAMTLITQGRRVIIAEGAERWREADVSTHLLGPMGDMPPETTLAIFAREDARAKAPPALHKAIEGAGGQIVSRMTVKSWELAGWAREQGARLGLELDPRAAKVLVDQVGERQQRLLRELEKLALEGEATAGGGRDGDEPAPRRVGVEQIEARAAYSAEWKAFTLADALVAGDARLALSHYLRLREQGERLPGLLHLMAQRLRDAVAVSARLAAGDSPGEIRRGLRMPPRAADRFVADVARSDPERLRGALQALADLEIDSRGGAPVAAARGGLASMEEDTLAVRAIEAITL